MTPQHTASALKAARMLAEAYYPINAAQVELQTAMLTAIGTGDMHQVLQALQESRSLATQQWREWHTTWLGVIYRLEPEFLRQQEAA